MRIFAVYDKKADCYNTPFFCANDGLAKRNFIDLCRDSRTVVALHPEDFELWYIGAYLEDTALLLQAQKGEHAPCQIMTGVEARVPLRPQSHQYYEYVHPMRLLNLR